MIDAVNESIIYEAAYIHSESWKESHKDICTPGFIAIHTPERQEAYLRKEMAEGKDIYMLKTSNPVGIVSVKESLIENLYVLSGEQRKGYGSILLEYAISRCSSDPTLWIISTNDRARNFYLKHGFRPTGHELKRSSSMTEIELSLRREETRKESNPDH